MKLQRCRTLLFMPGNNPGMLASAGALGSDVVIFDLEDAVAQNEKDAARILVRRALSEMRPAGVECVVRMNGLDTPHWLADIAACVQGGADIILLPKCEKPQELEQVWTAMREAKGDKELPELMVIVETAKGVENVSAIAAFAASGGPLAGILLGAEDLTADLGARRTPKGDEIFYARSRVLTACKAAGVKAIDTPFPFVTDLEGMAADADFAAQMGFDGKAVISPHHVHRVKEAFSPTEQQLDWATRVMAAARKAEQEGKGAVSLDGMMIDLPIIKRAERILSLAGD